MFSANQKDGQRSPAPETFIGPSVKLEGNFTADGDIVVDGILVGTLTTQGDIKVGPQAAIEAEVRAKNAYIAGKIKGNITIANNLKVASTAVIYGDIKTLALSVEEGAQLNGKLLMSREKIQKIRSEERVPERQIGIKETPGSV